MLELIFAGFVLAIFAASAIMLRYLAPPSRDFEPKGRTMQDDLERRIEALERDLAEVNHKTKTIPWTLLLMVIGLMGAFAMQDRMNVYFKQRLDTRPETQVLEVHHAE